MTFGRALLVVLLLGPAAALAGERIEIPIKQTPLTDGNIRYSIPVAIGGSDAIDVMLDTGSTGLRMLPGNVPGAAWQISDPSVAYGYGSGVRLNGAIAQVPVSIGGVSAPVPMNIQLVQKVDCYPRAPHCPASKLSQDDYGLGGDGLPGQGFRGIAGLSLAKDAADNPLTQMGARSWIIVLPRPGEIDPGKLVINPDESELSGYVMVPISGSRATGCLDLAKSQKQICGSILLDTGAPGFRIGTSVAAETKGWAKGDPVGLVFRDGNGGEARAEFEANIDRPSRISATLNPQLTQASILAGTVPYFLFSVLYDPGRNVMGFKAR